MQKEAPYNYSIFFDFVESYLPSDFQNIKDSDPIMQSLISLLEENDQFFSIINLERINYYYTSKMTMPMLGVAPEDLNPAHFVNLVHPNDLKILEWARTQIFMEEKKLFMNEKGSALMSYAIRFKNPEGNYVQLLGQNYIFYTAKPKKVVYAIQIFTNIERLRFKKACCHQLVGEDMSLFRFPDENLLRIGQVLTDREKEIVKLIALGLNSKHIAEKLDLSVHTVNTHRSNMLDKCCKCNISDLIFDMQGQGLLS